MFNDRCLHYVLDARGRPVQQPDALAWSQWFETSHEERIVAKTYIGDVEVSTVFLGLDHNFSGHGEPILWETMVFGGPLDEECDRYRSLATAIRRHQHFVRRVQQRMPKAKLVHMPRANPIDERLTRPISLDLVE